MKHFVDKIWILIKLGCILIILAYFVSGVKYETPAKVMVRNKRSSDLPSSVYGDEERSDEASTSKNTIAAVLSGLLPDNYNKLEIPTNGTWMDIELFQVYIEVSLFFRKILEINEKDEELLLDADLGLQWLDHRIYDHLRNSGFKDPVTGEKKKNLTLDSLVLKHIWKPDIFIDEMASVGKTAILSKLTTLEFLGDAETDSGTIVYSARNTLRLRCDMDFHYYPADTQTCVYHIRSYTYDEKDMKLIWATGQQGIFLNDVSDSNFDLQIESAEPNEKVKEFYILEKFSKFRDGKYSALEFTIKIRRKLSYHIVQTYLPSMLLIFITWLCFLLPANMVEARIGISMTTVLTLTAMFAAVRGQSPSVSYTMAIDIWMVFCIFFVFVALLLFTFIYWIKTQLSRYNQKLDDKNQSKFPEVNGTETIESKPQEESDIPDRQSFDKIVFYTKRYAFLIFSAIFCAFIICYWSWLLTSSNYFDWEPHPYYNAVDEDDLQGQEDNHEYKPNLYLYDKVPFRNNASYGPGEFLKMINEKMKEFNEKRMKTSTDSPNPENIEDQTDSVTEDH